MVSGDVGHLVHLLHPYPANTVWKNVYEKMDKNNIVQFDFLKYSQHEWGGNKFLDHKTVDDNNSNNGH